MRHFIDIVAARRILSERSSFTPSDQDIKLALDILWEQAEHSPSEFGIFMHEAGITNYDDEFDDSLGAGKITDDVRPEFNTYFEDRIWDMFYTIDDRFVGSDLPVYRSIMASDDWKPNDGRGLGIYWSWDRSAAHPHWGDNSSGNVEWLLSTKVHPQQVNWPVTLAMNANESFEEEKEIRLLTDDGLSCAFERVG